MTYCLTYGLKMMPDFIKGLLIWLSKVRLGYIQKQYNLVVLPFCVSTMRYFNRVARYSNGL